MTKTSDEVKKGLKRLELDKFNRDAGILCGLIAWALLYFAGLPGWVGFIAALLIWIRTAKKYYELDK